MTIREERIVDTLEEAKPLLFKHWDEIAHYKDIELNPDYDLYIKTEQAGFNKCYIARDDNGKMIGYAVFFIKHHPHYKQSLMAVQDIIFIDPERRGVGLFLIRFCDAELKKIGVQVVSHHVKFAHDFSKGLERMGYEKQDIILTKRLDK